jgi:chromosome segregation ATPase
MKDRRVEPEVFIEGVDVIIRLDLGKHKEMLTQTTTEMHSFREAAAHESKRKRHYYRLIGGGKYDDDALERSVVQIRQNIVHLTRKAEAAQEKIEHHTLIVDTLTANLEKYERRFAQLNGNGQLCPSL